MEHSCGRHFRFGRLLHPANDRLLQVTSDALPSARRTTTWVEFCSSAAFRYRVVDGRGHHCFVLWLQLRRSVEGNRQAMDPMEQRTHSQGSEYFDESPINSFSQRRALEQLAELAKDATPDARSNKTGFSMIGHGRKSRQVVEKIGGASRDRTDDLIVANDGVRRVISFICRDLAAEHGPLRSNSNRLAWSCLTTSLRWETEELHCRKGDITNTGHLTVSEHAASLHLTWDQLFDPCTNMRVGAHLLMAYHRQAATFASKFPISSFRNGVLSVYPPYSWSESQCGHRHVLHHCCKECPSARIRRHGRAVSGCRCPIFDPPLADCVRRSCLKDWSSFPRVDLLLRDLPVGGRGPHRASVLSGERLDDHLGDRVAVLVEHEVTAVEILQVGCRHNLIHDFRTRMSPVRSRAPAPSFQSSTNSTNGPTTVPGPTVVSAQNSPCPAPGAAEPRPH